MNEISALIRVTRDLASPLSALCLVRLEQGDGHL